MTEDSKSFRPAYQGMTGDIFKLAFVTGLLTVVTLGIYRFWARTRIRRFVWSSIKVDGDPVEYTGTGLEKLLGFLVAVVVLAIYLGIIQVLLTFLGFNLMGSFGDPYLSPEEAIAQIAALYITIFAVLPLVYFAQYRGRRYMLSRTRWRGLRFGMTQGALGYMLRAVGYGLLAIITLGILTPLATFKLNKYMVDRQWFGDAQFEQNGKWIALFPFMKHFLFALLILILAGFVAGGLEIFGLSMLLFIVGYIWFFFAAIHYQVHCYRYLTGNQVLDGQISFSAVTDVGEIVKTYILGGLLVALIAAACVVPIGLLAGDLIMSVMLGGSYLPAVVLVLLYLAAFAVIGAASMAFVNQPILSHFVTTTTINDAQHLSAIQQRAGDDMADADGFADALDVGGAF